MLVECRASCETAELLDELAVGPPVGGAHTELVAIVQALGLAATSHQVMTVLLKQ